MPLSTTLRASFAPLLALGLAGALLAGCGGQDDTQKISDTLSQGITSKDPKTLCKTFSGQFLGRVYDTQTRCVTVETKDLKDSPPPSAVDVSAVKVNGDKATAFVEFKGGDQDGARGEFLLVKENGEWRVNDLSDAFLRSEFKAGVANDRQLDTALKTCLSEKVNALDDAAFRNLAYGAMGDSPEALSQLQKLAVQCTAGSSSSGGSSGSTSGEVSFVRKKFEEGLDQSLKAEGVSQSAISCVNKKLRSSISDKEITALIGKSKDQIPSALANKAAQALTDCGATTGSGN